MNILIFVIGFVFGICIGSFLNALVYRLGEKKPGIMTGRSLCPHCKHQLYAKDLIPLFSFIFLKGKCRYCKKPIGWHYPLVELITACAVGILAMLFYHDVPYVIVSVLITAGLIGISSFDITYQLIPYKISWTLIGITVLYMVFTPDMIVSKLIGAVIIGGFLYMLSKLRIRGQQAGGEGDAEIGLVMGGLLGWQIGLLSLFISYIVGSIVSLGILSINKSYSMQTRIPFGPFLALGIYIGLIAGNDIMTMYLTLL